MNVLPCDPGEIRLLRGRRVDASVPLAERDASAREGFEPGPAYDPFQHAALLGIDVALRPLRRAHGYWLPDVDTILVDTSRAKPWSWRNILAHEIGHAVLGHRDDPPENEYAADRYATANLTTPALVSEALAAAGGDAFEAARRLRLTTRLLRTFATPLEGVRQP